MAGKHDRDETGNSGNSEAAKAQAKNGSCAGDNPMPASAECADAQCLERPSKRRVLRKISSGVSNGGSVHSESTVSSLSSDMEGNRTSGSASTETTGKREVAGQKGRPLSRQQTSMTTSSSSSGASVSDVPQWSDYTLGAGGTTTATSDSGCSTSSSGRDELASCLRRKDAPSSAMGDQENFSSEQSSSASRSPVSESQDAKEGGRITRPHANDVLCGRGRALNSHPGNLKFREFVQERKEEYILAPTKEEKTRITREVLERVRGLDPPGRFLVRSDDTSADCANRLQNADGSSSGYWVQTDWDKMFAKTSQALREGAPTVRATVTKLLVDTNLNPNPKLPWAPASSNAPGAMPAKALQIRALQQTDVAASAASSTGHEDIPIDALTPDQLRALSKSAVKEFRKRLDGPSEPQEQRQQEEQKPQQQEQQPRLTTNSILLGAAPNLSALPSANASLSSLSSLYNSLSNGSILPQVPVSNAAATSASSLFQHPTHNLPFLYQNLLSAAAAPSLAAPAIPSISPFPQQVSIAFAHAPSSAFTAAHANANQLALQQAAIVLASKQQQHRSSLLDHSSISAEALRGALSSATSGLLAGASGAPSNENAESVATGTKNGDTKTSTKSSKKHKGSSKRKGHKSKKQQSKHKKDKQEKSTPAAATLRHHSGRKLKKKPSFSPEVRVSEERNAEPQSSSSSGPITRRSLSFPFSDTAGSTSEDPALSVEDPFSTSESSKAETNFGGRALKTGQEFEDPFSTSESSKAETNADGGGRTNKESDVSSNTSIPPRKGFVMKFKQSGSSVSSFSSDNDETLNESCES